MSQGGATRFGDIRRHSVVDSTNRVVADLALEGAAEGLVVVADHQTAGRGRWGRRWEAPPGSSLLVSVLLRPSLDFSGVQLVTLAAGVAAAEACQEVAGVGPTLKWPNDVMADDRKLGGILTELVAGQGPERPFRAGDTGSAVVVGLGLNLTWSAPLPDGATALDRLTKAPVDRDSLLTAFLTALEAHTSALDTADGRRQLLDRYRKLCRTLSRTVTVSSPATELVGRATGIGFDGDLLVEEANGARHEVSAGEVTHLRDGPAHP